MVASSLIGLFVTLVEFPSNPNLTSVYVSLICISVLIVCAIVLLNRKESKSSENYRLERINRRATHPQLEREFPEVFAFLDSIDEIKNEDEFQMLESQLNNLVDAKRRTQDIETIRAIALAVLIQKKKGKN